MFLSEGHGPCLSEWLCELGYITESTGGLFELLLPSSDGSCFHASPWRRGTEPVMGWWASERVPLRSSLLEHERSCIYPLWQVDGCSTQPGPCKYSKDVCLRILPERINKNPQSGDGQALTCTAFFLFFFFTVTIFSTLSLFLSLSLFCPCAHTHAARLTQ